MVVIRSATAKQLQPPVDDLLGHRRGRHFDHRDLLARSLVADRIHHIRRLQGQEPRLLDQNPRSGDPLQRDGLVRERLAKR